MNFNIYLMSNVNDMLKKPLDTVIKQMIKHCKIYSNNLIEKFLLDLQENKLNITIENVALSCENVGNEIDSIVFGYGFVDFGKDSIIYSSTIKKRIVVWKEILDFGEDILIKVLAYLIEIYLSIDEKNIYLNYSKLSETFKKNKFFEYKMLTDFSDGYLPNVGGFRKSILDKWCYYLDFASADLISSYVTGKKYLFSRRSKFLKLLLKINDKSFQEMVDSKRQNNLQFIYSIMPDEYVKKISLFSIVLENTKNDTRRLISKFQLEIEIYRYISYLFYMNKFEHFKEDEKEDIISKLLKQSYTIYNPDIKLDCGII